MKKLLSVLLALVLVAGCTSSSSTTPANPTTPNGADEDKVITVGATLVPHAQVLNQVVRDVLAEDGWTLDLVEYNDYVQPNAQLDAGDLDANYYQTLGYMKNANEANGFSLVAVAGVHIEPMGIYSSKIDSIDALEAGADIAVPNDADNEDRALRFLIAVGLLNEPETDALLMAKDFNGNDETNPNGYVITELAAENLPRSLEDVDVAVINGNYALEANLPETNPAITIEVFNEETTIARTNFLVAREDNKDSDKIQALIAAIQSEAVQNYIDETYKGSVITSFIDAEGNAQ